MLTIVNNIAAATIGLAFFGSIAALIVSPVVFAYFEWKGL